MRLISALLVLAGSALSVLAFKNPIKPSFGSDPHMTAWNGQYYLLTTTWTDLQITSAPTIAGLKTATPKVIYKDSDPSRCCNVWAPELHYISGSWYVYYTAGSADTLDNQRTHVLKGGASPSDPFKYQGRIVLPGRDVWAIDSTVLFMPQGNFLVYSSWEGADQSLWIAKMTNAYTVGPSTLISRPTYAWETVGTRVNEGPNALYKNGRTFLTFSASGCAGGAYALGLLELKSGADPLLAASWTKKSTPVFSAANGAYAPGHNGNFLSPDGKEYWNVYHANKDVASSKLCDGARDTRVQKINWNSDGTPNFGSPLALSTEIAPPSGEKA